ncbi:MAG: glycosyltransferase, partial [Oscillospiraceae bacterium]
MNYDKKQVSLYFADNASTDDTVHILETLKKQYDGVFANFEVIRQPNNGGFGTASNSAALKGSGNFVFFFNVDTEIFPNALSELEKTINMCDESWGAFELRQFPYEHPKYYNPITMEVSWASGACFVLRRSIFEKTGGFDESVFMYGEDVDLSWHIRTLGYKIKYVPSAIIMHYAYKEAGEVKPLQMAGSIVGNLMLRYKYGTKDDISKWNVLYRNAYEHLSIVGGVQEQVEQQLAKLKSMQKSYRKFYNKVVRVSEFSPNFYGLDYEFARGGAFYESHLPKKETFFSVIIRTYNRPKILALTLESLKNQTYKNFEVIVVEDGENSISRETVEQVQDRLDLKYIPMNKNVGRCIAGNVGIENANGEFIVFLDDDDYFFAEQLEVFACLAEENPNVELLAVGAVESKCKLDNKEGTEFTFITKKNRGKNNLKLIDFCTDNPLPIQAIAFHKDLPLKYGMLDSKLDALEDWDMWIRFACKSEIASTDKATSIYKLPADDKVFSDRDETIAGYRDKVFDKMASYNVSVSAQDIYSIIWKPENEGNNDNQKLKKPSLKDEKEALIQTAQEILNSSTWRFSLPVRIITRGLSNFIDLISKIVNFILWQFCRIFILMGKAV